MRVRMKRTQAGPAGALIEGREYWLPEAEAAGLVDGGYAEQVAQPAPRQPEAPAGDPAGQNEEGRDEDSDAESGG